MEKKSNHKKKLLKKELTTSWLRIGIAVIAGIIFGVLILGPGMQGLTYDKISYLVILSLLACVLALLLDIRKIILLKVCP